MKVWQAFRWEWVSYPVTSEGTLEKVNEPGSCVGLKMELSERNASCSIFNPAFSRFPVHLVFLSSWSGTGDDIPSH